jgi:ATP-dependent helicase/nuclease subunit A
MLFTRAEDERLLYVAATRAADELIIGTLEKPASPSPWRSFHPWVFENGSRIDLPEAEPAERNALQRSADDIVREVAEVEASRAQLRRRTYRAAAVTARKSEIAQALGGAATPDELEEEVVFERRVRGTEWGSVVHDTLEAAARGASLDDLRHIARGLLITAERPTDPSGEPMELDELLQIIAAVQEADVWKRATAAKVRLIEVPFGVRVDAPAYADMIGAGNETDDAPPIEIIDGRMDLVFRDDAGWPIVDYKSDAAGSRIPGDLMSRYTGQIRLYASAWLQITGEPVTERVLLFTADGRAVSV